MDTFFQIISSWPVITIILIGIIIGLGYIIKLLIDSKNSLTQVNTAVNHSSADGRGHLRDIVLELKDDVKEIKSDLKDLQVEIKEHRIEDGKMERDLLLKIAEVKDEK